MREINRKDMLMYVAGSSAIGATIYYVSDKFQLPYTAGIIIFILFFMIDSILRRIRQLSDKLDDK